MQQEQLKHVKPLGRHLSCLLHRKEMKRNLAYGPLKFFMTVISDLQ